MVGRFEHVCRQLIARVQNVLFRGTLRISGHDKIRCAIGQPEADGPVVQVIAIIRVRREEDEGCAAELIGISRNRGSNRKSFGFNGIQDILKDGGGMDLFGKDHLSDFKGVNDRIQTADVILVRMCSYHIIERFNVLTVQIVNDPIRVRVVSGIDQHGVSVCFDQNTVSLANINEMNLHTGFIRI